MHSEGRHDLRAYIRTEGIPAPPVLCPFPSRTSPHAEQAQRYALHWATRHHLIDRSGAQSFAGARFANLMARVNPDARLAEVCLSTAWLTVVFALDDRLEKDLVREPARHRAAIGELVAWLRSGEPEPHRALVDGLGRPMCGALADVWRRTRGRAGEPWRARFVDDVADYLDGTLWEGEIRASGRLPPLDEYRRMRRKSAATGLFFDLIEPVHGIAAPDGVHDVPEYRAARRSAGAAIGLFNDLISWRKEAADGDHLNVVFVVQRERALSLRDAVLAAVDLHDEEVAGFLAAREALAAGPWAADPAVTRIVDDLANWIRGSLDWSVESARYAAQPTKIPRQRSP